jgi:hypothetical protein
MEARDKPFLLILAKRSVIFLAVICLVSLYYWGVGARSEFLDETESLLLSIAKVSSLGLVSASGIGVALSLVFALAGRRSLRVLGLLGYLAAMALGGAALVFAEALAELARGIR